MTLSDDTLVQRTRAGDGEAFTTLWARHSDAAYWAASAIPGNHEPDDVVQESFTRLLEGLQDTESDPITGPFRQYLYVVIRQVIESSDSNSYIPIPFQPQLFAPDDLDASIADRALISVAYESLSKEWKTILWYTEVEQLTAAEISPFLGISPNAVSALAYRAREGLRSAWLQAHIQSTSISSECENVVGLLGLYVRGSLGPRKSSKIQAHIRACESCEALLEEINSVARSLRANALFAVFGVLGLASTGNSTVSSLVGAAASGAPGAVAGIGGTAKSIAAAVSAPTLLTSSGFTAGVVGVSITGLAASVVLGVSFMTSDSTTTTPSALATSTELSASQTPQTSASESDSAAHQIARGFFGQSARHIANSSDLFKPEQGLNLAEGTTHSAIPSVPTPDAKPLGISAFGKETSATNGKDPSPSSEPKSPSTSDTTDPQKPSNASGSVAKPQKTSPSSNEGSQDQGPSDSQSSAPGGPSSAPSQSAGVPVPPVESLVAGFVVERVNSTASGPPYFSGSGAPNVDLIVVDEFGTTVGSVRTGADSNWGLRVSDSYSEHGKTSMKYRFYIVDSAGARAFASSLLIENLSS